MIDFYRYFNKPEKLDMHFEYADLIDKIVSNQFRYKNCFGPILHIIKKSPLHALQYARLILGSRWSEIEPLMLKNPHMAYYYAYYVINGRWIEAEQYIMKDPQSACLYAQHVIKDRWIEAEPTIMKNAGWWESYNRNILNCELYK